MTIFMGGPNGNRIEGNGIKGNGKRKTEKMETEKGKPKCIRKMETDKRETLLHLRISGYVHSNSNTSMSVFV